MPAPLSEARMKEIARVVATSPTMAGAAITLGYKNGDSLRATIRQRSDLREHVRAARKSAGRPTWGVC